MKSSAKETFLSKVLNDNVRVSFPKIFVKHYQAIQYINQTDTSPMGV